MSRILPGLFICTLFLLCGPSLHATLSTKAAPELGKPSTRMSLQKKRRRPRTRARRHVCIDVTQAVSLAGPKPQRFSTVILHSTRHYYRWAATSGQTLTIRLTASDNLSFSLYDVKSYSSLADGVQSWSGTFPQTANYTLEINNCYGSNDTAYNLELSPSAPSQRQRRITRPHEQSQRHKGKTP